MPEHTHTWQLTLAVDGCHHYQNTYVCTSCGVSTTVGGERQFLRRGKYTDSMMMALEGCERCDALMMGARRKPTQRYMLDPKLGLGWIKVKLRG